MPVPTTFANLSTTIASNSPAGSDNTFPDLDNYLRALSGMLASIYANSGNGWTSPYPTLTGTGASGTWGISVTGNAGTATVLQTARNINGQSFNGSADITVADATKLPLAGGTLTGHLKNIDGTEAAPAVTFANATNTGMYRVASGELGFCVGATEYARIDGSGNVITNVNGSAPTLSTNSRMVFALTSDTNLRINVRGTDGVTRVANITLA